MFQLIGGIIKLICAIFYGIFLLLRLLVKGVIALCRLLAHAVKGIIRRRKQRKADEEEPVVETLT